VEFIEHRSPPVILALCISEGRRLLSHSEVQFLVVV
jgi:hypothetical protein